MEKESKETKDKDSESQKVAQKKKWKAKKTEKEVSKPTEKVAKHLVRISGTVLSGDKEISMAISAIPGIGPRVSKVIAKILGFEGRKLGNLSEEEIDKLEKTIESLDKSLPSWMLNRRNSYDKGTTHLVGPDLEFSRREDINLQKKIKSYRGIRHILGQPVRGQRTRTSFRKGATVGVVRKKEMKPAKKEESGEKKKEK
ncbi:MAG: 30S ribosomal protein S13 [Candidatus Altiarchaeota archaeon]